jgi:protein O-GlcNAc transferase
LLRTGEFDGAAGEFRTVLRLDAKNAGAWQGLGLVHLQEGNIDEAGQDFRHALAIRPGYIDAEKGLAHALAAAHQWPEAAALLKSLLAANPNSSEETVALGNVLARMGDKDGAEKQFARGRELANDELILLRAKGENNWGVTLRKDGKSGEAAKAFRQALAEDPRFCEAHDNLGGVLWLQKDAAAAISEFQAAVQCDPSLASARNNLGTALLYSDHDLDKAIAEFRAAVALRPGFALAHLNLGKALATKQDFADAETEFRRAILIEPELAAAHMGLGMVLAAKTSIVSGEARAEMETALHLDPALRDVIPQAYLVQMQRQ